VEELKEENRGSPGGVSKISQTGKKGLFNKVNFGESIGTQPSKGKLGQKKSSADRKFLRF